MQCILTMQMYGVEKVCYSTKSGEFVWEEVHHMSTTYETVSRTIVRV